MHRRFCIGLHKIHRRSHGSTSMTSKFFVCLKLSNICYFSEGVKKILVFVFWRGSEIFFCGGVNFFDSFFFIFFLAAKKFNFRGGPKLFFGGLLNIFIKIFLLFFFVTV